MSPASANLPAWLPTANRLVKLMNRLGVPVGPVRVLQIPGRVSGVPRATPVTPVRVSGRTFVVAALNDADWALNARAAGHGELLGRRGPERVRLAEESDPAVREQVMRAFPVEVPRGVSFYVRLGMVTGPDPDQFAAIADRVAVFEILPAGSSR